MTAATEFFSRLLPRMIIQRFDDFLEYDGRVAFVVDGEGEWTVRLGDVETPIEPSFDDEAELKLQFTSAAFSGFVEGTLDVAAAVGAREVRFQGDVSLLNSIAVLLMPLQRNVGWEAG